MEYIIRGHILTQWKQKGGEEGIDDVKRRGCTRTKVMKGMEQSTVAYGPGDDDVQSFVLRKKQKYSSSVKSRIPTLIFLVN